MWIIYLGKKNLVSLSFVKFLENNNLIVYFYFLLDEKVETSVQTNYESSVAEKFNTNTTNTTLNNNSSSISSSSSSRSNSFKQDSYLCVLMKSYFNMPKELNRLYICETLGWLSFYSTTLFFTDFIAHVSWFFLYWSWSYSILKLMLTYLRDDFSQFSINNWEQLRITENGKKVIIILTKLYVLITNF